MQIATIKSCVAGGINVAIALVLGETLPSPSILVVISVIGLLSNGLALVCFILALRHIGATRSGAYFAVAPFVGAVLSILLLGEGITLPLLVAAGLMGLGVWLFLGERLQPSAPPAGPGTSSAILMPKRRTRCKARKLR